MISLLFAAAITGTLNLSWEPPTENTDGTPLTNLSGYKVSIGTAPGLYGIEVDIPDSGATSDSVEFPLDATGTVTVYVAMQAVNSEGVLSDYSNEVSKTFTIQEVPKVTLPPTIQTLDLDLNCVSDDETLTCTVVPQ